MKHQKILLAAAIIFATPAHAGECDEETIRSVTRGGSVIVLESGGMYQVDPGDAPDTALWNAGDGILLCGDDEMINKDNGGKASVTFVR